MKNEEGLDPQTYTVLGIEFQQYSLKEIKKLSVKEITNPQGHDSLQNCNRGGLYDPDLGTINPRDPCEKCRLPFSCPTGYMNQCCPGHMGTITLPLPVFNPVNFNTMFKMLTLTCFGCHSFLKPRSECYLFLKQMQAVDHGLISILHELENIYKNMYAKVKEAIDFVHYESLVELLDKHLSTAMENNNLAVVNVSSVKHSENVRNEYCKRFLDRTGKGPLICKKCNKKPRRLRQLLMGRIFFDSKVKKATKAVGKKKQDKVDRFGGYVIERKVEEPVDEDVDSIELQNIVTPTDAKKHLREVWVNDREIVERLCGFHNYTHRPDEEQQYPTDMFFVESLLVPPARARPVSKIRNTLTESPQSSNLKHILLEAIELRKFIMAKDKERDKMEYTNKFGQTETIASLINKHWYNLQVRVNGSYDQQLCKVFKDGLPGIKQIIERKKGILRYNMMGKRVNCSARSVISPDPYIGTNEVGIPIVFAKKLLYTEPVIPRNFEELRRAVINGPDIYPGATSVQMEDGKVIGLHSQTKAQREAIANQLLTPTVYRGVESSKRKTVNRHLKNGDALILNRQPTLHKPSMQAFKARILPMEKTLRINYTPCKAFNADFDGDEMNAHFPQSELARSEGYNLACADYQYLVPKDGTPVAGLIQDHMVSGVLLTIRGQFFCKRDYQELVYASLTDKQGSIKLLPPSIIRPQQLWSGKQVLSTMLLNLIPKGMMPLTLVGKSKISDQDWVNMPKKAAKANKRKENYKYMSESEVFITDGELLVGVLDKNHYGATAYGLVHCCYELYGGDISGKLLTCLGRLFAYFLRAFNSFTMGIDDILLKPKGNKERGKAVATARECGTAVVSLALRKPTEKKCSAEELSAEVEQAHFSRNTREMMDIDGAIKLHLNKYQDSIKTSCWPQSLLKSFPANNLQLMVVSGAKGSLVNCMQISCLLGQVDLEGRRPPIMVTGASLPSFTPYDLTPRAGGFIDNRFLTGLDQQEYFFHCMAGREGLVDTAVKTSRSGYLQRCLIKHLEGLTVSYDATVRESDGSIIQFYYGEDGLDVLKTPFLSQKQFPFMIENRDVVMNRSQLKEVKDKTNKCEIARPLNDKLNEWKSSRGGIDCSVRISPFVLFCKKKWATVLQDVCIGDGAVTREGKAACEQQLIHKFKKLPPSDKYFERLVMKSARCPDPTMSIIRPDLHFECTSERFQNLLNSYIESNPDNLLTSVKVKRKPGKKIHKITAEKFRDLLSFKYQRSLVHPGEAVGILAATSMGEQTTQMTLNTFHFAGHGAMNVTLGIPRLREILMTASKEIKTPVMMVPLLAIDEDLEQDVKQIPKRFRRIDLKRVLKSVEVKTTISILQNNIRSRLYQVRFELQPLESYESEYNFSPAKTFEYLEKKFFKHLVDVIKKREKELNETRLLSTEKVRSIFSTKKNNEDDEDDDAGDETKNAKNKDTEVDKDFDAEKGDDDDESDDDDDDDDKESDEDEEEKIAADDDEVEENGPEENGAEDGEEVPMDTEDENTNEEKNNYFDLTNENSSKEIFRKKKKRKIAMNEERLKLVCKLNHVNDYKYDAQNHEWCEVTFQFGLENKEMDLLCIIEKEVKKASITMVNLVSNCQIQKIESNGSPDWMVASAEADNKRYKMEQARSESEKIRMKQKLQVEGINIPEMYNYQDRLDVNQLYTNNIQAMAEHYGIEAANQVIIQEIRQVFKAYGIDVDYRHMSLIADYMTFEGRYKAFNRSGIDSNASVLQKMTFETAMNFLRNGISSGARDSVDSPSARLMAGIPIKTGTGYFDVRNA